MKDVERERHPDDFDPERQGKPRDASHAAPREHTSYGKHPHEGDERNVRSQQSADRRGPRDEDELDEEDTAPDTAHRYDDDEDDPETRDR